MTTICMVLNEIYKKVRCVTPEAHPQKSIQSQNLLLKQTLCRHIPELVLLQVPC